ncbi:HK97 gp10 family phage protein [Telmatobacter bradus]|uniref:HK97 gp10 family phage protein n=1 Tax=Telmatobacter bradus TaxID=474953 RepID=UPI003B42A1B1
MAEFKLQGLNELDTKFMNLSANEADRCKAHALVAGGRVIQKAITERAPMRPVLPSRTALPPGALAQDIELLLERNRETKSLQAVIFPGKLTAWAAKFVEYGHRMVKGGYMKFDAAGNVLRKAKNAHQIKAARGFMDDVPAYPFIRPGFEASVAEAIEASTADFVEQFEAAARK